MSNTCLHCTLNRIPCKNDAFVLFVYQKPKSFAQREYDIRAFLSRPFIWLMMCLTSCFYAFCGKCINTCVLCQLIWYSSWRSKILLQHKSIFTSKVSKIWLIVWFFACISLVYINMWNSWRINYSVRIYTKYSLIVLYILEF